MASSPEEVLQSFKAAIDGFELSEKDDSSILASVNFNSKDSSKLKEHNIIGLLARLNTYASLAWSVRPSSVSPLACAGRGWTCRDADLMTCVTCERTLGIKLPASTVLHYDRYLQQTVTSLTEAHDNLCPWKFESMTDASPLTFNNPVVDLKTFLDIAERLLPLAASLKTRPELDIQDASAAVEFAASLSERLRSCGDSERRSCGLLALAGWTLLSGAEFSPRTRILRCLFCQRRVGLWNLNGSQRLQQPLLLLRRLSDSNWSTASNAGSEAPDPATLSPSASSANLAPSASFASVGQSDASSNEGAGRLEKETDFTDVLKTPGRSGDQSEAPTDNQSEAVTGIQSEAPADTTDQSEAPADTTDQSEAPADTTDQSEAPADTTDQSEAPAETTDTIEVSVSVEVSVDTIDQSKVLVDAAYQSETPADTSDQLELHPETVSQSETPTITIDQSETPAVTIDQSETPTNTTVQLEMSADIADQLEVAADATGQLKALSKVTDQSKTPAEATAELQPDVSLPPAKRPRMADAKLETVEPLGLHWLWCPWRSGQATAAWCRSLLRHPDYLSVDASALASAASTPAGELPDEAGDAEFCDRVARLVREQLAD